MTTGFVAKEMLDSESGNIVEDTLIPDKMISNDSEKNNSIESIEKVSNINQTRIVGEDFQLNVKKVLTGVASLPDNWSDLTVREQRDWFYVATKAYMPNLPNSLIFLYVASLTNGNCDRASGAVPEWLDREKFKRGQRFAMDNYAGVTTAELLSLNMLFSFENGLKPMIITGKSSDPFTSFKRYLSTGRRVKNWYSSDVWTPGTDAYRDIQTVRKMHANIRKKLQNLSYLEIDEAAIIHDTWSTGRTMLREDFRASCPAPLIGQCPHVYTEEERFKNPKGLNQADMAGTQFGFMALVILYPESFGIHGASDEDLDAFCHLWRGLGYLLGIEDEFNFCKGTLEEVKQRSRDFIEYWVKPNLREITPEWEHMMRCVVEGLTYYIPNVTYEQFLLYFAEIIDIRMPRLQESLSYNTWIQFNFMKISLKWTARLPGVMAIMNQYITKCSDRAFEYTDDELAVLRKKSEITLSKGIAETIAVKKDLTVAKTTSWEKASFFVFSSAFLLLNLQIFLKEYVR